MNQRQLTRGRTFRFKRFAKKSYSAFNSMHKVVSIGVVTGLAMTLLSTSNVSAQTKESGEQQQKVMEKELEEVMVTASKVSTPINQTARLVTIISREEIQQAPVQSIQELLIYAANVDVVQRGGHGVQADISIRGGSFDQNAVLLNGVNLSNPHTGHYNFDIPINLSDIERIEIIHGPSALIYGASAFSGGINIITIKNTDYKVYANVEAGMHQLRTIEVRGAVKSGITLNSLSVGNSSSEGYMPNSDYDIYNALWQTRFSFSPQSRIDLQLGYNNKKYGANTFYSAKYSNQYERTSSYIGSVKGEFGTKLKFIPIAYWNRHHDQFDLIKDTNTGRNYHRNDTYGANLILSYQSKLGNTSVGGELRREDVLSSNLGLPLSKPHRKYTKYSDRTNSSVALEHTLKIDRVVLSGGVLMNHNSMLDGEYSYYPSFSVAYRPIEDLNISASWSKSTRMPTFTDLYYSDPIHKGDDGLKPEKSESLELGVKYKNSFLKAYATGFLLWGRNMIDWVKDSPEDSFYSATNHSKIDTKGLEVGVDFRLMKVFPSFSENAIFGFDYTHMNQRSDAGAKISQYSLNYLRDKLTVKLNHPICKHFSAAWFFRYQKRMGIYERYNGTSEPATTEHYPAFTTLDLKLIYKLKDFSLNLTVNNLYDTHYFDKGNVPQAGFWMMGGVSYTVR